MPVSTIKQHFEKYLLLSYKGHSLSPIQYECAERAFYGGAAAMFSILGEEIEAEDEDKSIGQLSKLDEELATYWKNAAKS